MRILKGAKAVLEGVFVAVVALLVFGAIASLDCGLWVGVWHLAHKPFLIVPGDVLLHVPVVLLLAVGAVVAPVAMVDAFLHPTPG